MKTHRITIRENEVTEIMTELKFAAERRFAQLHQSFTFMDYEAQLSFNEKHNAIKAKVDRIEAILTGHRPHRKDPAQVEIAVTDGNATAD